MVNVPVTDNALELYSIFLNHLNTKSQEPITLIMANVRLNYYSALAIHDVIKTFISNIDISIHAYYELTLSKLAVCMALPLEKRLISKSTCCLFNKEGIFINDNVSGMVNMNDQKVAVETNILAILSSQTNLTMDELEDMCLKGAFMPSEKAIACGLFGGYSHA